MSAKRCITVIAGTIEDRVFSHLCFIAENLAVVLPNFNFKVISTTSLEWELWLQEICAKHGWSHTKSPLVWRQIGITRTNINYIGGAYQFWELLYKYYNITSHLNNEDLEALQTDFLLMHNVEHNLKTLNTKGECRRIMVIGAGRSLCPDLIPQLIMMKELWLSHGVVINLYDEPGCYFKIKRIIKDMKAIGGGLHAALAVDNITDGLHNCDILIYLDALTREDHEETESWLDRNFKCIQKLAKQINEHAPARMKVIFCSTGPTCFCVDAMHALVTKLPSTSIVALSSHYGLELIYSFLHSLSFDLQGFGSPPVWGYTGINQFVDMCHMIQTCDVYRPNRKAIVNKNPKQPIGIKHLELRWFFYMAHNKDPYRYYFQREATTQYQVGRSEDFQKCRAICDLLKLWYSKNKEIGDEIVSLGIASDGSFGIPKGLVFSQPVHLKVLEDNSRIWVPFADFPMPNIPMSIFQNLIDTALIIKNKIITGSIEQDMLKDSKEQ